MLSRIASTCLAVSLVLLSQIVSAQSHLPAEQGEFSLPYVPKRIVALELSFVDSLAALGLSPVGIADDNDPEILLPEVKQRIGSWTSLGLRAQPSLEQIAALKPDLIIADSERHSAVYEGLAKIAPTLLLKSRGETYQENLTAAVKIAAVVGRSDAMMKRLVKHKQVMAHYRNRLSRYANNTSVQFAVASARGVWLHAPSSYAAGVLKTLGFSSPMPATTKTPYLPASLEVLLGLNPDWLLMGSYGDRTVFDDWHESPLFSALSAVQQQHVKQVSPALWSLNRGIFAAEGIAADLTRMLTAQH